MLLRHPPSHVASATVIKKCSWKRTVIAAVILVCYAVSLQFSLQSVGEPRDWAIGEQKRLLKIKAKEAKEKGESVTVRERIVLPLALPFSYDNMV